MIPGVVLAAGRSSRMGRSKALLSTGVGDETFLTRIVSTLWSAGLEEVMVVIPGDTPELAERFEKSARPPRLLYNPAPERGQLSSLLVALEAVDRPGVRAVLVTLVDLPLVSVETVRAVLDAYRRSAASIVRPERGGKHGHPVIFDRCTFDDLRRADPLVGAKAVFAAYTPHILNVSVDDEGAFQDIDTPDDYRRLVGGSR